MRKTDFVAISNRERFSKHEPEPELSVGLSHNTWAPTRDVRYRLIGLTASDAYQRKTVRLSRDGCRIGFPKQLKNLSYFRRLCAEDNPYQSKRRTWSPLEIMFEACWKSLWNLYDFSYVAAKSDTWWGPELRMQSCHLLPADYDGNITLHGRTPFTVDMLSLSNPAFRIYNMHDVDMLRLIYIRRIVNVRCLMFKARHATPPFWSIFTGVEAKPIYAPKATMTNAYEPSYLALSVAQQ